MANTRFMVAFLLPCLTFVHTASVPAPLQVLSVANRPPTILTPNNSSLTAPTLPPRFGINLTLNQSIPISPVEAYINAIEMMGLLSTLGWNNYIKATFSMSNPHFKTKCAIAPFPDGGPLRLQVKHAAVGLYRAGTTLSQKMFFMLQCDLLLQDDLVGGLAFEPKPPKPPESAQSTNETGHADSLEAYISNMTLTADSGVVDDPEEDGFSIIYQFDGVKLKAQDIFTSFLDALTISAQFENRISNAEIPAAKSISGDVVLSTWVDKASSEMTWLRLKRAIMLLWEKVIIGKQGSQPSRFEGLYFDLAYAGQKIGAGRMLRFSTASDGTGDTAVSKS